VHSEQPPADPTITCPHTPAAAAALSRSALPANPRVLPALRDYCCCSFYVVSLWHSGCPRQYIPDLRAVFPGREVETILVVPTCQRGQMDMLNTGPELDRERDRLLEEVRGKRGTFRAGLPTGADGTQDVGNSASPCIPFSI